MAWESPYKSCGNGLVALRKMLTVYNSIRFVLITATATGMAAGFVYAQFHSTNMIYYWIAFAIGLGSALLCSFSKQIRCICSLLLPMLLSRLGRKLLFILIIGLTTSYPTFNIITNLNQQSNSTICVIEKFDQQFKEGARAFRDLQTDLKNKIIANVQSFITTTRSIDNGINKLEDGLKSAMIEIALVSDKCTRTLGEAHDTCLRGMSSAQNNCESKLKDKPLSRPFVFVCKILDVNRKVCGVSSETCKAFTDSFGLETLRSQTQTAVQRLKDLYKFNLTTTHENKISSNFEEEANLVKSRVQTSLADFHEGISSVLSNTFQCIFFISLGIMIFHTCRYVRKLRDNSKNNNNNHREEQNDDGFEKSKSKSKCARFSNLFSNFKFNYFPSCLKKGSKSKSKSNRAKNGQGKQKEFPAPSLMSIFMNVFACLGISVIDWLVYWSAVTITEASENVNLQSQAAVHTSVQIEGGTVMALFVRGIMKNFEIIHNFKVNVKLADCIQPPHQPSFLYWVFLGLAFILVVISVFFEKKLLSKRWAIASSFYPQLNRDLVLEEGTNKKTNQTNQTNILNSNSPSHSFQTESEKANQSSSADNTNNSKSKHQEKNDSKSNIQEEEGLRKKQKENLYLSLKKALAEKQKKHENEHDNELTCVA